MNNNAVGKAALLVVIGVVVALQCYRGLTFSSPELGEGRAKQLLGHDFRWLYASGRCWLLGVSPHIPAEFQKVWVGEFGDSERQFGGIGVAFPNPPTLAILSVPVAMFEWNVAYHIFDALDIFAYILTLYLLYQIACHYGRATPLWRILTALALVSLSGAVPGVIYVGQTSLVATLGVTGVIYSVLKGRLWVAACWMILASVKPQLSILPFVWLCVQSPGLLYRSTITVGIVSLLSLAMAWDSMFFRGMLESLALYREYPFNRLENSSVALYRLFGRGSIALLSPLIAVVLTGALSKFFQSSLPATLGIPILLTSLLLPIHPYDVVILMVPFFLFITFSWSWFYLPALALTLRPNAFVKMFQELGFGPAETSLYYVRWLTLLLCIVVLVWNHRQRSALMSWPGRGFHDG